MPPPPPSPRATARLIAFALEPPASCASVPEGLFEVGRFDFDADGDEDLVLAPGDDPAAPLPWWLFVREADGWRPLRGAMPRPAFRLVAAAASDGAVVLGGEGGETWIARR